MRYTQTLYQLSADTVAELDIHDNQFEKISRYGINFMRKANNEVKGEIRTERFLVPTNRIIQLPASMIAPSKIGVQYREGVKLLAQNPYLANLNGSFLPQAYPATPAVDSQANYNNYFYGWGGWGNGTGRILAYGNNQDLGKFSINWEKRTIQLSSDYDLNTNIYIEYLSDCIEANSKTMVHPFLQLSVQMYQKWMYFLGKKEIAIAREYERLYLDEYQEAKVLFCGLDPATIINLWEFRFGGPE